MRNKVQFRQCRLVRHTASAVLSTVAYLPARYATVGHTVRIKGPDGVWSEAWRVTFCGDQTDNPPDWRKLIRGHRRMTGDALTRT